jgi:S-formylglutathione hydrolase FrmB
MYLPPGYDDPRNARKRYPALMGVVGFTGSGPMLFNMDPMGEDTKARLDRLISSGKCPPVMVAAPDCFTKVGGNQYINSSATGRYEDFLVREVVPFVNRRFRTGHWGVFGKSSGGYGAIVLGMRHPEVFQALADHSGDSNFELCYMPDMSDALDAFRKVGGPAKWLKKFWADDNRRRGRYMKPLNALAMAAHYSPNPRSPHLGIDFPFDLETGVFLPKVWKRWQAWDPVRMVARYAKNLRKLRCIYVDCGSKDEFTLHWGARALVDAMRRHGLKVFHQEFDDGHMSISYRYDVSVPMLARALSR